MNLCLKKMSSIGIHFRIKDNSGKNAHSPLRKQSVVQGKDVTKEKTEVEDTSQKKVATDKNIDAKKHDDKTQCYKNVDLIPEAKKIVMKHGQDEFQIVEDVKFMKEISTRVFDPGGKAVFYALKTFIWMGRFLSAHKK